MKKYLSLFLCIIMLLSLAACGGTPAATAQPPAGTAEPQGSATDPVVVDVEPLQLAMGDPATTGTFLTQNAQFFADKVYELSGGKMEITVYADGLLGTEDALLTNIQIGSLEMGDFSSTFANLVTKAGIFDFPYMITDRSQLALLEDAGIIDEIKAEAETFNIKIIAMNENGFRHITNNKRPVTVPEDLKGIVIRTPSNTLRVKTFEVLGATPVAISFSELYQSLSQGICDAQENPLSQIISAQLYDVQDYLSLSNHVYTPAWICMNLDLYNSLSDAQREIIDEAGRLTTEYVRERAVEFDVEMLAACEENGMEINETDADAFRALVMPLWEDFTDNVGGAEFVNKVKEALGY